MTFLELAGRLIPGYDLLPLPARTEFESSQVARSFVAAIKAAEESIDTIRQRSTKWSRLRGHTDGEIEAVIKELPDKAITHELVISPEYQSLISKITFIILPLAYPDAGLLDNEQKRLVAEAEYSGILQKEYIKADNAYKAHHQKYTKAWVVDIEDGLEDSRLEKIRHSIVEKWYEHFFADPRMSAMRTTIGERKAVHRAQRLGAYFPFLNDPHWSHSTPLISRLLDDYNAEVESAESESRPLDLETVEKAFLADLLYRHLNDETTHSLNFINLEAFNQKQARLLAEKILQAFNDGKALTMKKWLDDYQNELIEYIRQQITLIDGKEWQESTVDLTNHAANALSYLWDTRATQWTNDFLNRIGDAYSFLQYMGATAQNDNFVFSIIDVYNLYRNSRGLAESKSILLSLFKPFLPLYQEYKEIAKFEKSFFRKVFRTVMPLVIIAGFVILVAVLLPTGIPELAFIIAAIPTLFIGIALATKYVTWKNSLSQFLYEWYYGGPFATPEFAVNERMIETFGTSERAEEIRSIYISEIQRCNDQEDSFKANESHLNSDQQKERQDNLDRRLILLLEWYDIHSNSNLAVDIVQVIVEKQLTQIGNAGSQAVQKSLNGEEGREITKRVHELVKRLKDNLSPRTVPLVLDLESGPRREMPEPVIAARRPTQPTAISAHAFPTQDGLELGDEGVNEEEENPSSHRLLRTSSRASAHSPHFFTSLSCIQEHRRVQRANQALTHIRPPAAEEFDQTDFERTVPLNVLAL
ncbi:hypothetical protein [Legionella maceachernii]|uniref:Uncharacterized protein n=1 Tax=Legionella maceachernii TaxID=466 RepID=A0A0W0WCV9_9GAMM|nr:hypothetical protein [Legionella maceachernii]KTD30189.1 hypothetical protein Lmac_0686 [Legionella maceachernii]SJZ92679.1 hypothetical protein SAMN02745128_01465 [Legionella maceachernii]SUP03511.1 Uncharacterised protein [Legionella maceachernii]